MNKVELKLENLLNSVKGEFPHIKTTRGKLRYRRYIRILNKYTDRGGNLL